MQFHEVATIFPMMSDDDFSALRDDIKANGLRQPITTWRGKIVDGRNRYKACKELGITPHTVEWDGRGSLTQYVVSLNLARRHLTASQKAAIAVDMLPMLEEEARKRIMAGKSATFHPDKTVTFHEDEKKAENPVEKIPQGKSRDQAARIVGANPHYVSDAKRLHSEAPALFEKVKTGELSITQAKREHRKETAKPAPQVAGSYSIIYADPPWKYSDNGMDNYGPAERHYEAMSIADLCALPVSDMAMDNAALFMWVTSPMLEEAFKVIRAWGFSYRTSFVWDKVKHNFGHYNSVRHEFLLVCVRGSYTPQVGKLFDSVQSIERTDTHSQKPEEFRQIIETLYPQASKIELFARQRASGWESWGNEL